ncbi:MAG: antibiotic biosynthesis monooxygenase [Pseudoxanthomonas sp.]
MSDNSFAQLPRPPYYAVIFSSQRNARDEQGYGSTAQRIVELAQQQPGYLGVESTRGSDDFGITVSYWETEEAILAWRRHLEHAATRGRGRSDWYDQYELRVARVERAYGWDRDERAKRSEEQLRMTSVSTQSLFPHSSSLTTAP